MVIDVADLVAGTAGDGGYYKFWNQFLGIVSQAKFHSFCGL